MGKFRLEENGYNRKEVNQFIVEVIQQTEKLISKIKQQETEINNLKEKITRYQDSEDIIKKAIISAEKTSDNIIESAYEEQKKIILNAKQNASTIIDETLNKAKQIDKKSEIQKNNIKNIEQKIKELLEEQKALIEKFEEIE